MFRFVVLSAGLISVAGCQSLPQNPKKTYTYSQLDTMECVELSILASQELHRLRHFQAMQNKSMLEVIEKKQQGITHAQTAKSCS